MKSKDFEQSMLDDSKEIILASVTICDIKTNVLYNIIEIIL